MNRIFNSTKLDLYTSKSTLKLTAILLIPAIIMGVASHGPEYAMLFTMVFAVTSCGTISSTQEKNHSEKLYGILPLKKSEMIVGRYLYALTIGAAYSVTAGIMGFVLSQAMGGSLDALSYWAALAVGFVYFGFAVGVSYPIYLKFTFAKAYIFTMLPMYIIAVLLLLLTRKTNFISKLSQITRFFTDHLYLAPIFGLLGGLILLTVSALVANLIYTSKEI